MAINEEQEKIPETVDRVDAGAFAVKDEASDALVGEFNDTGDDSILNWLIPLFLLGLLIILGYWFCSKSSVPIATTNTNTNTNAKANANTNTNKANVNVSNGNTNIAATNSANTDVNRTLTEVSLPNGTKINAYPGGIEDQLIKFIQSDEYKNGTNDTLKDKWFNFDDLNFQFNSTMLEFSSKRQVDNIVAILKAFPNVKIKIGAYTDKKGDDAANKTLSDNRAKNLKALFEKEGVGAQVPEAEGYGEEFAKIAETAGDEERKADRRTAVRLLK